MPHLRLHRLLGPIPLLLIAVLYAAAQDPPVQSARGIIFADQNHNGIRDPGESVAPPRPVLPIPSPRQLAWHEKEYYAFVHFNSNTFTGFETGSGHEQPSTFNPTDLDVRSWVRLFRDAGMKGVVIVAKHHEGFCIWPSAQTDYTLANSPLQDGKGDIVREVSDACREFGLAFGFYLSPWDLNAPVFGETPKYNAFYRAQLQELLTGYGKVFHVWFDGFGTNNPGPSGGKQTYDWKGYRALVRELQPGATMFSDAGPDVRWVGNEDGLASETNWCMIDRDRYFPGTPLFRELGEGNVHGKDWVPAECDVSIRSRWFWHPDDEVKSVEYLLDIYYKSVGRNASLHLNIPPDTRGRIGETETKRLLEMRRILDQTFAVDHARGRPAVASNTRGGADSFAAACAVDGNRQTYWATDDGVTKATLEIDLGSRSTFNVIELQEQIALGQRVKAFMVEASIDNAWRRIAQGTTIGYKRLLRLDKHVTAEKIRLSITDSRACPTISQLGVYTEPNVVH